MIITVIIIWTPTQKPIKHVASGKSKTDLSKSWLVSNVVVFSTSDHQIRIIFSSCPVNRLLPVSFLTEKNVGGLSLSLTINTSSCNNVLFFSLSTLSLCCVFAFSFSLHRPLAGEIAVAGGIHYPSFTLCKGFLDLLCLALSFSVWMLKRSISLKAFRSGFLRLNFVAFFVETRNLDLLFYIFP
jgi:hypothetical protein